MPETIVHEQKFYSFSLVIYVICYLLGGWEKTLPEVSSVTLGLIPESYGTALPIMDQPKVVVKSRLTSREIRSFAQKRETNDQPAQLTFKLTCIFS